MPQETAQPFDKTPRSTDDPALVEQVLGTEQADDMRSLVDERAGAQEPGGDLDLAVGEQAGVAAETEKTLVDIRRDQYFKWAARKIYKGRDWVDETFTFNSDGTVVAEGNLDFAEKNIDSLPLNLVEVSGSLDLFNNNVTSLEGMPDTVSGYFALNNNPVTSLDGMPTNIGENVYLKNIPATSIPAGLNIGGSIYLSHKQKELIADCGAKGYKVQIR